MGWSVSPVCSCSDASECSADEIVHKRYALCGESQAYFREQYVVIDDSRAVTHFNKNILGHHAALELLHSIRSLVIVKIIAADPCALSFPVTPDPHCGVMDMVPPDYYIDRRVQLDPRDLSAAQLHHVIDIMYVVVLDDAEDTAHTADDTALLTVMYIVMTYYVAADILFEPSVILPAADRISLHLCRTLHILC